MMSTMILRIASRLLVPLSLVFAAFIFFKGHQTPGGGFVGGLVASMALIVHRMSYGGPSMNRMLPAPERVLIGLGLLIAMGTGAMSLLWGTPFLTSAHGYLPLTGTPEPLEWTTVLLFDLGVFLVVTGTVVGMINTLSEELR